MAIGINDFVEVKFFENRANGQSKGFCVVTLGSDQSMRMCMDRLPKKELHGQCPVVTYPNKQSLNQVTELTFSKLLYSVWFACFFVLTNQVALDSKPNFDLGPKL